MTDKDKAVSEPKTKKRNLFIRASKAFLRAIKYVTKNAVKVFIKLLFLIVVLALVLSAGVWFLFAKYVNAEQMSSVIARQMEIIFNRPVAVGAVKLKLLNEIEIENLEILGPEDNPLNKFLSVKKATLRFNPLLLLDKEIAVEEVSFEAPRVSISVNPDGTTTFPSIRTMPKTSSHSTRERASGGTINIGGTDFIISLKDWEIEKGTFIFEDTGKNVSHMVYNVKIFLSNLHFDKLSDFKTEFMFRNTWQDKIAEIEAKGSGRVNFSDFNWSKFNVRNFNLDLFFFKNPVKINFDMDNIQTPFLTLTANIPAISDADFSLFVSEPPTGFNLPASKIKTSLVLKNAYKHLAVNSLEFSASDIKVQSSGNFYFDKDKARGDLSIKTNSFNLKDKNKFLPALTKFNLSGSARINTSVSFADAKASLGKIESFIQGGGAKLGRFVIEGANGTLTTDTKFRDVEGSATAGTLHVTGTTFTEVNAKAYYRNNSLVGTVNKAKVNGNPIAADLGIYHFNSDARRQIDFDIFLETLDPMEIIRIVEDFVDTIAGKNRKAKPSNHNGDLKWLRDFRTSVPNFMPKFKGNIAADNFKSSVISGKNFMAEFDLKGLKSELKDLDGKIDAQMENGVIYQLERKAAEEKILGVAFQPFIIMHRMEKAGSFKVGSVLKDVPFSKIVLSTDFLETESTIKNMYMEGRSMEVAASGVVNWLWETLNTTIYTIFKNTSRSGAIAENLTDATGAPALAFRVHGNMEKPSVEMLRSRTVSQNINKSKKNGIRTKFEKAEKMLKENSNAQKQ
ncbi:AsmA-like C-terminal region [Parelusimicrobium proximum]|uniref:AsmA family protein n=1 Tax=Parelusimicrobium proximum TaxID=3228953 RepID=UPI003D1819A5